MPIPMPRLKTSHLPRHIYCENFHSKKIWTVLLARAGQFLYRRP